MLLDHNPTYVGNVGKQVLFLIVRVREAVARP